MKGGVWVWVQTASDQGADTAPMGEPLVEFLSVPPSRPAEWEGRKVAVPKGRDRGVCLGYGTRYFWVGEDR